ncbi:MAG: lipopolysaccharide assembly LapA domain-containing protein [bacterium]
MIILRVILISIITVVLFLFAFQNQEGVRLEFLKYRWENIPLFIALYLSFGIGVFLAAIMGLLSQIRQKIKLHQAKREIKQLQEELNRYRLGTLEDLLSEEEAQKKQ